MIPAPHFMLATPQVHPTAWVAPTATVLGQVTLEEDVSVFYGAVLRGDIQEIRIGQGSAVIVQARLPSRRFEADGHWHEYYDGMPATAEVRVRSASILVALVPDLRAVLEGDNE